MRDHIMHNMVNSMKEALKIYIATDICYVNLMLVNPVFFIEFKEEEMAEQVDTMLREGVAWNIIGGQKVWDGDTMVE